MSCKEEKEGLKDIYCSAQNVDLLYNILIKNDKSLIKVGWIFFYIIFVSLTFV